MIYSRQVFEAHPPTCLIAEQVKTFMLIIDLQEKTDSKNEKLTLKFQHEKEEATDTAETHINVQQQDREVPLRGTIAIGCYQHSY